MEGNNLKLLWAEGHATLNGWCSIGNPFSAEIMAAQGYNSITIDMQHGALDYSAALPMFQAMRASGVTLIARVPWRDPAHIMKALDAGAMGIICPMVNSRAEAEEFVSYMRYPPLGQRSFGPTRVGIAMPGYGVAANDQVLALAMIETADGVANLEEIAATPGLDGIYVGPADLTLGTQEGRLAPGFDREEPEMVALIQAHCRSLPCQWHSCLPALRDARLCGARHRLGIQPDDRLGRQPSAGGRRRCQRKGLSRTWLERQRTCSRTQEAIDAPRPCRRKTAPQGPGVADLGPRVDGPVHRGDFRGKLCPLYSGCRCTSDTHPADERGNHCNCAAPENRVASRCGI